MSQPEPFILFRVDKTTYALPAQQVAYIDMPEHITPVPHAPDFVVGVVYSRGQVLPVVDLRRRFGLPPKDLDLQTRLIVVRLGERTVALLADAAREFANLDPEAILLPPEQIATPGSRFLSGVVLHEDQRLVFVLDLEHLLSPEEVESAAQAAQTAPPPSEGKE